MAAYALCAAWPWRDRGFVNENHAQLLGSPGWAAFLHDEVLPAESAREAYELLLERNNYGKVVLKIV